MRSAIQICTPGESAADNIGEYTLNRKQAAAALTERGYQISPATLASFVSRGNGPVYRKFGARVVYRLADLIAWAKTRVSDPVTSSAELKARR